MRVVRWLARWGFATLVGCGAVAAIVAAAGAEPPTPIPTYALQAAAVYRLEVGAAVFVCFYFGSLALALSFSNRAFTEVGSGRLKAGDIGSAEQEKTIRDQDSTLTALMEIANELRAHPRGAGPSS